jgi:hypothetical protein
MATLAGSLARLLLAPILVSFSNDRPERPNREQSPRKRSPQEKKLGNRVFIIGRQRELALYRAEFLRLAGCTVSTPENIDEALRLIKRVEFDAIVLSYTLPSETVQWLADSAREHCPDCPIIAITQKKLVDRRIAPDAIVLANHGPGALLAALGRVLQSRAV